MKRSADRLRVLLVWPGGLFSQGKSFGVPQLLTIAAAIRDDDVDVEVVDLDFERAFGAVDLARIVAPGYDLIGLSCYSSYEYLKVMAVARRLRALSPSSQLVTGGYHPSARPDDFTREGTPFDYVVVGDGERPMQRLVRSMVEGKPPTRRVLEAEPTKGLDELPALDWNLLSRYRPIARKVASQAQIYLSRGCPFSCAFCMERAKRCTAWRAYEPSRALDELHRLDDFLDLSRWTLFVTDALFGLDKTWRRTLLEALASRPIRARKIWLLARADLLEREDLVLMARANVAPGFGLESGDPGQLARIQKARSAQSFLEHFLALAAWARELELPFGANVIAGHPGETEQTLRNSAAYLRKLFLGADRTTGFLSVDPFRLYPGSAIDEELDTWVSQTGMRAHRYPWWEDGDQDFLSEWVDPSSALDFRSTERLRFELFGPVLREIPNRFSVRDAEAGYFRRSIDEQVALLAPRRRLRALGLWHLWRELTGEVPAEEGPAGLAADQELARVARNARRQMLEERKIRASTQLRDALEAVPRERFVELEDVGASADDRALALLGCGGATVSAPHAYVASFEALGLEPGDHLVDLGGGTGYGSALAAHVVGPSGSVHSVEIDARLVARAQANLAGLPNVRISCADAHDVACWGPAAKVTVGFAVESIPSSWIDALEVGGKLVAPVGPTRMQMLTLVQRDASGVRFRQIGRVVYVPDRGSEPQA